MDAVAPLAGQLVQILTPFLPYLVKAGEGVGSKAAQVMQDQGWDLAKKVWDRLGARVETRTSAQEAAADLAAQPSDEDAQAALRVQLRKLLADEPGLQKELEALVKSAQGSGTVTNVTVSGDRSVGIGGNFSGGTIVTGDQGAPRPPRP
jgi:hypothetical protein